MDVHELTVLWPLYFEYEARERQREEEKPKAKPGRRGH